MAEYFAKVEVEFLGERREWEVYRENYRTGHQGLTVFESGESGELWGFLTVNLLELQGAEVAIKTYSENEGWADLVTAKLVESGKLLPAHRTMASGWCTYPVHRMVD